LAPGSFPRKSKPVRYSAPEQAYALAMRGNQLIELATPVSEDVVTLIVVAMLTSMTIILSGAASLAISAIFMLV
jgi:hypothetical protein